MRKLLFVALSAATLFGCRHSEPAPEEKSNGAETVMMDGFKLWRETVEDDIKKLRAQAGFDLSCGADKLQFHVLSMMTVAGHDDWASDIAVMGCGQKARYTRVMEGGAFGAASTWVLQSKGADNGTAPAKAGTSL